MPTRPQHHPLADAPPPAPARAIRPRRSSPTGVLANREGVQTMAARPATHTRVPTRADAGRVPTRSDAGRAPTRRSIPDHAGSTGEVPDPEGQDGSVATEYGLLAVVAATIVSVMLEWATSGGISNLLASVMARVSSLVGL